MNSSAVSINTLDKKAEDALRQAVLDADWLGLGKQLKIHENSLCAYQWLLEEMKDIISIDTALDVCAQHGLTPNWAYTADHGMQPYIANQIRWLNRLIADRPEWVVTHGKWLSACAILLLDDIKKVRLLMAMDYALSLNGNDELQDDVFNAVFYAHFSECDTPINWPSFLTQKWLFNGHKNTKKWLKKALNNDEIAELGAALAKQVPHKHAPKEDIKRFICGLAEIHNTADFDISPCLTKEHVYKALTSSEKSPHEVGFIDLLLSMMQDHIFLACETRDPSWCLILLYLWSDVGAQEAMNALQDICQQHSRNIKNLINNSVNLLFDKASSTKNEHLRITSAILNNLHKEDCILKMALEGKSSNTQLIAKLIEENKDTIVPDDKMIPFIDICTESTLSEGALRWLKCIYRDKDHTLHTAVLNSITRYVKAFGSNTKLSKHELTLLTKLDTLDIDSADFNNAKDALFIMLSLDPEDFYSNLTQLHNREDIANIIKTTGMLPYELLPYANDPVQRDGIVMAM